MDENRKDSELPTDSEGVGDWMGEQVRETINASERTLPLDPLLVPLRYLGTAVHFRRTSKFIKPCGSVGVLYSA